MEKCHYSAIGYNTLEFWHRIRLQPNHHSYEINLINYSMLITWHSLSDRWKCEFLQYYDKPQTYSNAPNTKYTNIWKSVNKITEQFIFVRIHFSHCGCAGMKKITYINYSYNTYTYILILHVEQTWFACFNWEKLLVCFVIHFMYCTVTANGLIEWMQISTIFGVWFLRWTNCFNEMNICI